MFEDATFESLGTIRTRSRGWMIATFALNASILLAMILVPLIYPAALPRMALAMLMEAPPTLAEQPKPVVRAERATAVPSEIQESTVLAPRQIPRGIYVPDRPETSAPLNVAIMIPDGGGLGSPDGLLHGTGSHPNVVPAQVGPAHISSGVAQGLLIHKVVPDYPPVPRAAHIGGIVVLQATISKSGTIENLHVASGPELLRQAALDAVKQWRYRPYLLNGEPVEVETTVNVEFKLQ
jgi:protein TonB